jgi:hypothetical protein
MLGRFAGGLSLLVMVTLAAPAAADLYQWTDQGARHYTSDLASIPEAYRSGARDIGGPRVREAPAGEMRRDGDAGVMRFRSGAPRLLGRDVLDYFTLTVDGAAGRATLTPR